MIHPWTPLEENNAPEEPTVSPPTDLAAWAELFATTIAHLAAQLTTTQLRLRALASVVAEQGGADPAAVQAKLVSLAEADAGRYLRENLGAELTEAIEVESLERDLVAFLRGERPAGA